MKQHLWAFFLSSVAFIAEAQYDFTTNNGAITITQYTGPGGVVTIPNTTNGYPIVSIGYASFFSYQSLNGVIIPNTVTNIDDAAFAWCANMTNINIPNSVINIGYETFFGCSGLTSVTIPGTVTSIGDEAFENCSKLAGCYFQGNAPSLGGTNVFAGDTNATVYYVPDSDGWTERFGGLPASLWNATIQTTDGSFGVQNNQFGFNITGTTNIPIVIEATTNLTQTSWIQLFKGSVTNGAIYFGDPQWTDYLIRFYRITSP
jgi:BspA type Leucine rich repeat region (6 copies)